MSIKTIIFDWDGTLGMTLHLWLAGYNHGLANQGHSVDDHTIAREMFNEHSTGQQRFPEFDFNAMVDDAMAHMHDNLPTLRLYQHAEQTLQDLSRAGIKLALVSSSPRRLVERGMLQYQLAPTFLSIITGNEVTNFKPHAEPFEKTLHAIQSTPEETLIIGDSIVDIQAGKAAGTRTCLFTPPENDLFQDQTALHATNPDITIDSLSELQAQL